MDEYDLEEDVFDPASIVRDMVADDSAGRHLRPTQKYAAEKETLIGKVIPTSAGLSWTVRNDILQLEVVEDTETEQPVGVKKFDFNNKTSERSEPWTIPNQRSSLTDSSLAWKSETAVREIEQKDPRCP